MATSGPSPGAGAATSTGAGGVAAAIAASGATRLAAPSPARRAAAARRAARDPRDAPEAAAVAVGSSTACSDVQPRHPVGDERLLLAVDHEQRATRTSPRRARRHLPRRTAPCPRRPRARRAAARRGVRAVRGAARGCRGPYTAASLRPCGPDALLRARVARRAPASPDRLDSWLEHLDGEPWRPSRRPAPEEGGSASRSSRASRSTCGRCCSRSQYDAYPNIRALLPSVPDTAAGALERPLRRALAEQSAAFYRLLRERTPPGAAPWPARACSTSAAAGGGSRGSSRATCRPSACTAATRCRRSSTSAARPRPGDARAQRLPPRAAAVRRAASTSPSRSRSSRTSRRRRTSAACGRCTPGWRPAAILVVTIRPPAYLDSRR